MFAFVGDDTCAKQSVVELDMVMLLFVLSFTALPLQYVLLPSDDLNFAVKILEHAAVQRTLILTIWPESYQVAHDLMSPLSQVCCGLA